MKTYAVSGTITIPNDVDIHEVMQYIGFNSEDMDQTGIDLDLDQLDLIDADDED